MSLGITCTLDPLESMCPPRGVSCPSTHHIHRQSMSIPKNVSVSQYGGNVNNTMRTFLEQKPTLCVCFSGQYRSIYCTYIHLYRVHIYVHVLELLVHLTCWSQCVHHEASPHIHLYRVHIYVLELLVHLTCWSQCVHHEVCPAPPLITFTNRAFQ